MLLYSFCLLWSALMFCLTRSRPFHLKVNAEKKAIRSDQCSRRLLKAPWRRFSFSAFHVTWNLGHFHTLRTLLASSSCSATLIYLTGSADVRPVDPAWRSDPSSSPCPESLPGSRGHLHHPQAAYIFQAESSNELSLRQKHGLGSGNKLNEMSREFLLGLDVSEPRCPRTVPCTAGQTPSHFKHPLNEANFHAPCQLPYRSMASPDCFLDLEALP